MVNHIRASAAHPFRADDPQNPSKKYLPTAASAQRPQLFWQNPSGARPKTHQKERKLSEFCLTNLTTTCYTKLVLNGERL